MDTTSKPRVATIIVLGHYYGSKFVGLVPTIFGQTRGFYNEKTGDKLKGSPGERSIFGEHFKPSEDRDIFDTAVRCAHAEFWLWSETDPLTRDDFELLASDIETTSSVNDLLLLKRLVSPDQIGNGEGDGLLHIPLAQLHLYVRDGNLTEASIATLATCDVAELWQRVSGQPL